MPQPLLAAVAEAQRWPCPHGTANATSQDVRVGVSGTGSGQADGARPARRPARGRPPTRSVKLDSGTEVPSPGHRGARSTPSELAASGRCSTTWTCTPPTVADCPSSSTSTVRPLRSRDPEELDPARDQDRQTAQRARRRSASGCSRRRRLRTAGARPVVALAPVCDRRSMRSSAPGRIHRRWVCATSASGSGPRSTSSTTSACRDASSARSSNRSKGSRCGRPSGSAARSPGCASRPGRARRRSRSSSRDGTGDLTVVFTGRREHRRHGATAAASSSRASPTRSGAARVLLNPAYTLLP